ncbi:hypothetical protein GCM10010486_02880 [Nonomuraea roseoviolacea subsp. carminata]
MERPLTSAPALREPVSGMCGYEAVSGFRAGEAHKVPGYVQGLGETCSD